MVSKILQIIHSNSSASTTPMKNYSTFTISVFSKMKCFSYARTTFALSPLLLLLQNPKSFCFRKFSRSLKKEQLSSNSRMKILLVLSELIERTVSISELFSIIG